MRLPTSIVAPTMYHLQKEDETGKVSLLLIRVVARVTVEVVAQVGPVALEQLVVPPVVRVLLDLVCSPHQRKEVQLTLRVAIPTFRPTTKERAGTAWVL